MIATGNHRDFDSLRGAPLVRNDNDFTRGGNKMKETMLAWKAALVVFFTALGELLGFVRTLNPSYAYAIDGGGVHMDF